jgi:hypothetical protein
MTPRRASWSLVVALVASSRVGFAQTSSEEGARRELLSQAEQAAEGGDHTRALDLARRASSIRPSTSLVAFMARELRALDRRVEALDQAGQCLREVAADATLRNRDTLRDACEAVRASVEPHVARLTIRVADASLAGLTVQVGEQPLVPALYGVPSPVMPGRVVVSAAAPGFAPFTQQVEAREGEVREVDVSLTALPPPPSVPEVVPPPQRVVPVLLPPPRASMGPGPWIVGGVALASVGVAGIFYGLAMSARDDRDARCPQPERGCPPDADADDARYAESLVGTNVAIAIGATAAVGAAAWFVVWKLTHPSSSNPPSALLVSPTSLRIAF